MDISERQNTTTPTAPGHTNAAPFPQETARRRPAIVYIGIDPGASGGIAWIDRGRIRCLPTPSDRAALWHWFAQWQGRDDVRPFAMIEMVGGYVRGAEDGAKNGGAANGARMFQFGRQYGELLMGLCAAGIKWGDVAPQAWQGYFHLRRMSGDSRLDFKRRIRLHAQATYPSLDTTLSTADAILICTYLYRVGIPNV